jgi:hypothetical protein
MEMEVSRNIETSGIDYRVKNRNIPQEWSHLMVTASKPTHVNASQYYRRTQCVCSNLRYGIRHAVMFSVRLLKLLKAVNKNRVWGGDTDVSKELAIFKTRPANYYSFRKLLLQYTASHPARQ